MNYPKTTVIGLDVSAENFSNIESIRKMDFLQKSDIHFVHVVKEYLTGYDVLLNAQIVIEEDKDLIRSSVLKRLEDISKDIIPYNHQGKVKYHCLTGVDPKQTLVSFAADVHADLMVLATRNEHAIFDASFAHYCALKAPSDVLVIRESPHDKFKGTIKVSVAAKVDEDFLKNFSLKKFSFLSMSDINIIHVSTSNRFSFFPGIVDMFPPEEKQLVICEAVNKKLLDLKEKIVPEKYDGKYEVECLFSTNVKKSFCEKVNESDSDLVVIYQNHKNFGSFLSYQLMHGEANVLVVRGRA